MTNAEKLDAIFRRIAEDHGKLTDKQAQYAIKEIGRVRGEMALLLADYADGEGTVARTRLSSLMRELDGIEKQIRDSSGKALDTIITQSAEWTTTKIESALVETLGVAIKHSQFDRINRDVFDYVIKRYGDDGLVLSDRVWDLSAGIREDISSVLRSSIIRGEGVNTMVAKIRTVYDNDTWKIERLARTESLAAYRTATAKNAEASDVVNHVKLNAGIKHSKKCVALAEANHYGLGRGIYPPDDHRIYSPHPNCTSYLTYVLDERYL